MSDPVENELLGWQEAKKHLPGTQSLGAGPTPLDEALTVQKVAALLIRTGYLKSIGKLIPLDWTVMTEAELTAWLSARFTEPELMAMFEEKSLLRQALKTRPRSFSLLAAVAVALIWCRDDLDKGAYWTAGAKFTGTVGGAYALNRYFYGRDKAATELMAEKMGNYGRWFQGVARGNRFVNFLTRRLTSFLLIWQLKDIFMSGGLDGPNIPFDFVIEIDLFDKATWQHKEPPSLGLDLGMNFFYYQMPTPEWRVGYQQICLGVVRGSLLRAPARGLRRAWPYVKGALDAHARIVEENARMGVRLYGPKF
jgi:hypothetical protein